MKKNTKKPRRSSLIFDELKQFAFPLLQKRGCAEAIKDLLRNMSPQQKKTYSDNGWNREGFRSIKYVPDGFFIDHEEKQIRILEIEDTHNMKHEKIEAYYDISEMLWDVIKYNMKIILVNRFGMVNVVDPEQIWIASISFGRRGE